MRLWNDHPLTGVFKTSDIFGIKDFHRTSGALYALTRLLTHLAVVFYCYSWYFNDDGSCQRCRNEKVCMATGSSSYQYRIAQRNVCQWQKSDDYCYFDVTAFNLTDHFLIINISLVVGSVFSAVLRPWAANLIRFLNDTITHTFEKPNKQLESDLILGPSQASTEVGITAAGTEVRSKRPGLVDEEKSRPESKSLSNRIFAKFAQNASSLDRPDSHGANSSKYIIPDMYGQTDAKGNDRSRGTGTGVSRVKNAAVGAMGLWGDDMTYAPRYPA